jgi:pimeloyl-ACP methyl ester carboxylesterase
MGKYLVAALIAGAGMIPMESTALNQWPMPDSPHAGLTVTAGEFYWFIREGTPDLSYYFYLPVDNLQPKHVLVSVHGISRDVEFLMSSLRPWADRHGVALVLPVYDRFNFYDYQRLGRNGYGPRADLPLLSILDDIHQRFGIETHKVAVFGFSGGAQFAHRFALIHPSRVSKLGIASAGWYTWPDENMRYPFGVADAHGLDDAQINLAAMLQIPTCVFVGERDAARTRSLNTLKMIDDLQGEHRLQRAQNWVRAMRAQAGHLGVQANIQLEHLPRTRHSYKQAVSRGQLMPRLFRCLFND